MSRKKIYFIIEYNTIYILCKAVDG